MDRWPERERPIAEDRCAEPGSPGAGAVGMPLEWARAVSQRHRIRIIGSDRRLCSTTGLTRWSFPTVVQCRWPPLLRRTRSLFVEAVSLVEAMCSMVRACRAEGDALDACRSEPLSNSGEESRPDASSTHRGSYCERLQLRLPFAAVPYLGTTRCGTGGQNGAGSGVYCTAASRHFPWSVTHTWVTRNRPAMVSPL